MTVLKRGRAGILRTTGGVDHGRSLYQGLQNRVKRSAEKWTTTGLIRFGDPVAANRSGGVWPAELAFRLEPILPIMARRTAARL